MSPSPTKDSFITSPEVKIALDAEKEKVAAAITLSFCTDPMARWSMPDPEVYLSYFPALVRAFAGDAFTKGTAHHIADFAGAALWLQPGSTPDFDSLNAILEKAMPAARLAEVGNIFEKMEKFHPTGPHWYLPLIGVDPHHHRKGYGSALLQFALRECDRNGIPAYLESSNPANIPLYERHGFSLIGKIQEGSSPALYPMLRNAGNQTSSR